MENIGVCGCGCGGVTEIASSTRKRSGWIKGQPKPYLQRHSMYRSVSRDGRTKVCKNCQETKLLEDFYRQELSPDGRQILCKKCSSIWNRNYVQNATPEQKRKIAESRLRYRSRTYGLNKDELFALYESQNYLCSICGKPEHRKHKGKTRMLAVDHDHVTGKVRGLLCMDCNQGIGRFRDDPILLKKASDYLQQQPKRI